MLQHPIGVQPDGTGENKHVASDRHRPTAAVCRRTSANGTPVKVRVGQGLPAGACATSCVTITTTAGLRCGRAISKLAEGQMDQLVSYGGLPW